MGVIIRWMENEPGGRLFARITGRIALYATVLALTVAFALPFFWLLTSSLKTGRQAFAVPPVWFPNPVVLGNYPAALTSGPFLQYTLNTLEITAPRMVGSVFVSALVAYGFARIDWDGRDFVFFLCLSTMMIPFAVTMIPLYIVFFKLGWVGSYLPLQVPWLFGTPFHIFLLRQFFMTIPRELDDAARVDGAGELRIFWGIVMPLSKPALAVVGLFTFLAAWSDYLGPLIYIQDTSQYTLSLGLWYMGSMMWGSLDRYAMSLAASTAVTIPVVVVFFLAQRTFIEGVSITGLKG
ncbi:MAG: carbohydrate ABC transporter permease [Caldilineaceae bacterium]|nr:carbohydrate ABC transporter permease [Caldilineaceae bacterium]